jgi:hypothetical protein
MTVRKGGRVRARRWPGRATAIVVALSAAGASAFAQGVRATSLTTTRYVEIRPLARDTVPRSSVTELPDGTFQFNGQRAFCISTASCILYRSTEVEHAIALVQDVDITAWGLGVPGLSITAALRARARLSGDFVWPRSDDSFDAMLAYAEYDREPFRIRLGRQRTAGGLGFAGYDGASFFIEPHPQIALEAYGGRSLARALYEPRSEALRGVEDFLPDRDAWLIGAWTEMEPVDATSVALRYQREIWTDRSALLSERASLDVRSDLLAPVSMLAGADYDFAFGRIGKAHVTARMPVSSVMLDVTGRRYLPYFELWTIWGFFSPVAYHEAEVQASWRARRALSVQASAAWRKYEEAQAPVIITELKDETQRYSVAASFEPTETLLLLGEYQMERGFGAFLSSGDVSVRWQVQPRVWATFAGTAFQQIEQFRLGEGAVVGGSASVEMEITPRIGVDAGLSIYRQTYDNRPAETNWNQRRGWAAVRITLGSDPGLVGTRP